jgi:hypothetical protein
MREPCRALGPGESRAIVGFVTRPGVTRTVMYPGAYRGCIGGLYQGCIAIQPRDSPAP